jgi:hypothetical protein
MTENPYEPPSMLIDDREQRHKEDWELNTLHPLVVVLIFAAAIAALCSIPWLAERL